MGITRLGFEKEHLRRLTGPELVLQTKLVPIGDEGLGAVNGGNLDSDGGAPSGGLSASSNPSGWSGGAGGNSTQSEASFDPGNQLPSSFSPFPWF